MLVGVFAISNLATAADDPASVLMRRALGPTPILEDLRLLTDTIGGRPTGSAAVDRAVDWGMARLMKSQTVVAYGTRLKAILTGLAFPSGTIPRARPPPSPRGP